MALHNRILSLHQDPDYLYYRAIPPTSPRASTTPRAPPTPPSSKPPSIPDTLDNDDDDDDTLSLITHYLNLGPNLTDLYTTWSASDPNFAQKAPRFTGVRILRQDPWEALVGFICSSNNNIARISQMVHKLCVHYGPLLGPLPPTEHHREDAADDDDDHPVDTYHDFPTPAALARDGVEAHLRALGFGYRAKYIHRTAYMLVHEKPPGWLASLQNPESPTWIPGVPDGSAGDGTAPTPGAIPAEGREGYRRAHAELLTLQGVGPKVADCVCLMGLGWGEAVPVDTHVWQIAQRDYKFGRGKHASLTKATYDAVAAKFRALWGREAGWAHSVLFTADLKAFSGRLVVKTEKKEEEEVTVKREGDEEGEASPVMRKVVKEEKVVEKAIKREFEEDESKLLQVEERTTRAKRRRRG
jgi:N-glycosylase/DNA lyase